MADRELHTKLTCWEGLSNKAHLSALWPAVRSPPKKGHWQTARLMN